METIYRQLKEVETGRVVVARLEIADSLWRQTVGLMGRRELAGDSGLWLATCNGVHTFGMRFALDLLFLDRHGLALYLKPDVPAGRICGPIWRARTVVELPAGTIARQQIVQGKSYHLLD